MHFIIYNFLSKKIVSKIEPGEESYHFENFQRATVFTDFAYESLKK